MTDRIQTAIAATLAVVALVLWTVDIVALTRILGR